VYDLSDVFILPSKGPAETWGLSVNEAMANGKPVIVSNKCGCAIDLIEDYKNGFIFESENKEDLSNKLLQLYSQRNSISIMKENAKNKIASYSFIKVAQAIEDIVVNL
jgi:glycosyltransferase involved in cell wall biosynthesis